MIEIQNLKKTFRTADGEFDALNGVSISVADGEIYGIIGMSGAGKSTLVRCINMLERPTAGTVCVDGVDLGKLKSKELRAERRKISMIFQNFNLLMQRNCLDNVCFPLKLAGVKKKEAKVRAQALLETVGLADKAYAYPAQLSGGQKQRVAIARALASDPKVLLCDEATSALDPKTTQSILELIRDINRRLGITVIVITHQMNVIEEICDRVAVIDGGRIVEEGAVADVFSAPKSEAARRIVFPEDELAALPYAEERIVRLVFNGSEAAATPLIAGLAVDEGISANILYASTRNIGGKVYGKMLVGLPGDDDAVKRAIDYLNGDGVSAGELVREDSESTKGEEE